METFVSRSTFSSRQQPHFRRFADEFDGVVGREFLEEVSPVVGDGVFAHEQLFGDELGAQALGQQQEHFFFARREAYFSLLIHLAEGFEYLVIHRMAEVLLARRHFGNGFYQFFADRFLGQKARGSGLYGLHDVFFLVLHGQEDHPGRALPSGQVSRHLNARHAGHGNVAHQYGGGVLLHQFQGLYPVGCFTHHPDAGMLADDVVKALPQDGVVVGEYNGDGH